MSQRPECIQQKKLLGANVTETRMHTTEETGNDTSRCITGLKDVKDQSKGKERLEIPLKQRKETSVMSLTGVGKPHAGKDNGDISNITIITTFYGLGLVTCPNSGLLLKLLISSTFGTTP
jgi:hypothetical protein